MKNHFEEISHSSCSIYESCNKSAKPIESKTVLEILDEIKNGILETVVESVRAGLETKEDAVPAVTFSGKFSTTKRAAYNLLKHSGLGCADIDNVDTVEAKKRLANDPYVFAAFNSVSGKGLAVLFIIADVNRHRECCENFRKYLIEKYGFTKVDDLKDVTRLRIMSYDPAIIINKNVEVFPLPAANENNGDYTADEDFENLKREPDAEFIKDVARIKKARTDITETYQNWRNIAFAIANKYGEEGRLYFHEISQFHSNYAHEDCDSLYTNCLKSDSRKNFSDKKITIATFYDVVKKYFPEKNQLLQYDGLWSNNFKAGNVELSTSRLKDAAVELGYCRFNGSYIQNVFGVLKKVEKENLYEALIKLSATDKVSFEVKSKEGTKLKFTVDKDQQITLAQKTLRGNLSQLAFPEFQGSIARDTTKEVLSHFENKSIKISAVGIAEIERSNYCVWEDHIIKHQLLEEDFLVESVFETFIRNISGENFEAFCTALGYLLRNCNGADGLKAAWLYDHDFEAGKLKGRTGKSLIVKALGQLRKLDLNSGKDFDHVDRFKLQGMDRDTQITVLDDVKENLNFTALFNYCSEGAEYQRKFANKVKLSIYETPKLIITSNYPPPLEQGASVIGRIIVLPVLPYYSSFAIKGGVKHIHGHTFFDDWEAEEWNRFFWFMINCVQKYLQKGLLLISGDSSLKNRLKAICATKLKDEDQAEHLVEWLYDQPYELFKRFSLDEIKSKWSGNDFETEAFYVDDQRFANCLKVFIDIKGWQVKKTVERIDGKQKRFWNVT